MILTNWLHVNGDGVASWWEHVRSDTFLTKVSGGKLRLPTWYAKHQSFCLRKFEYFSVIISKLVLMRRSIWKAWIPRNQLLHRTDISTPIISITCRGYFHDCQIKNPIPICTTEQTNLSAAHKNNMIKGNQKRVAIQLNLVPLPNCVKFHMTRVEYALRQQHSSVIRCVCNWTN